jgi:ribosomal protein S18 acetylase RimI-like enzyme
MQNPLPSAADAARLAGVSVRVASPADLAEVLRVQRAAFGRVARAFGIPVEVMPPVSETLEDLHRLFESGMRTFVASDGDRIVGAVRAEQRDDGVVEIGRLAVDDGFQRRGIGLSLMLSLEESYPAAGRFELFTGEGAAEPLALYAKLRYGVFKSEQHGNFTLVWLAKQR